MTQRRWVAPLGAGLVAFVLSLLFVATGTWSLFDEYTHFDYVAKVGEDFTLPPVNDTLGQTAMQAAVCGPAPGFGGLADSCGAQILDPTRAPYRGASTATGYLPTYYAVTGLGARLLVALPGDLSWLHAARLMGALYLALAAALVVLIARRLGASSLVAFAFAVLVAAMPMVLLQFSTVNNDSLAVVLSLAAVWAFLAMAPSSPVRRSLMAFGIALVAMTVKETAVVAVLAVTALSLRDVIRGGPGTRVVGVVRVLASAAVAVLVPWVVRTFVHPAIVGSNPDNGLQNAAFLESQGTPPINLVAANALRGVSTVFEIPEGTLAGAWFSFAAIMLAMVAFGIPLALVLRTAHRRQWLQDSRVLAVVVLVGVPLFIAGFLLMLRVSGLPLFFQPRYMLGFAVLGVAVAASFVRPAWGRGLAIVALVLAVAVGVSLAVAPEWTG